MDATALLVLAHVTDTARRHVAVGLDATVMLLVVEAVLILCSAQEGEMAHTVILLVGEHIGEQAVSTVLAAFLAVRTDLVGRVEDFLAVTQYFLFPLRSGHRVVECRQAVTQGADILHQGVSLNAVGKPVDAQHVVLQVGCKYRTVIGQQLATFGLDGHGFHEHIIGLFVPLGGLHCGGLDQVPHNE